MLNRCFDRLGVELDDIVVSGEMVYDFFKKHRADLLLAEVRCDLL